jgi:hypothetical protein
VKVQRDSPPNTPQRQQNAEREQERENRILGSPENRRMPQPLQNHLPIPFHLDMPPGPPLPASQNDPFQIVNYGGQPLALTQRTAAAVNALPPLAPPLCHRGRAGAPVTVNIYIFFCQWPF